MSLPWRCETSKHSIRRGMRAKSKASASASAVWRPEGLRTRKRRSKECRAFRATQSTNSRFRPRRGTAGFTFSEERLWVDPLSKLPRRLASYNGREFLQEIAFESMIIDKGFADDVFEP